MPKPPKEVPVQRDLGGLAPKFRVKVEALVAAMHARGFDAFVFETGRTQERQNFLYGFGRSYDDGRGKVTFSKDAKDTWHGYWLAVDIISKSKLWGAPAAFWTALGEEARKLDLRWGNDWDDDGVPVERDKDEGFSDRPHVQWGGKGKMRRKPSSEAARLQAAGGVEAVWRAVGAA